MTEQSQTMDRVLVLEMVRVTEAAAMAAAGMIGRGDEKAADASCAQRTVYGRHCRNRRR